MLDKIRVIFRLLLVGLSIVWIVTKLIIYKALGIPVSMFTVMFAIARTVGWVAQWLEQSETPTKIGRPRQVYNGPTERRYRALHRRG